MLFLLNPQIPTSENVINITVLAVSGHNFHFFIQDILLYLMSYRINKLLISCNIQPYSDHLTLQILLVLLQFDALKQILAFPSFSTTSTAAQGVCNLICGNKMPTRCNRGFYCRSYCLLNMFRAPLCPSSGAQEHYTVVAACGISYCGAEGYISSLQDAAASCKPDTKPSAPHQTSNLKTTAQNTTGSNHCIILLSS